MKCDENKVPPSPSVCSSLFAQKKEKKKKKQSNSHCFTKQQYFSAKQGQVKSSKFIKKFDLIFSFKHKQKKKQKTCWQEYQPGPWANVGWLPVCLTFQHVLLFLITAHIFHRLSPSRLYVSVFTLPYCAWHCYGNVWMRLVLTEWLSVWTVLGHASALVSFTDCSWEEGEDKSMRC